jgi:hypothetical protein
MAWGMTSCNFMASCPAPLGKRCTGRPNAATACAQRACSAHDVLPVLFKRPLDLHQTTFAMGEAVAHLHCLWHAGQLRRSADAQGVWRFTSVAESRL